MKLEVWLSFYEVLDTNIDAVSLVRQLGTIANNANKIFNGTVTTVLFSGDLFYRHISVFTQKSETVQSILGENYQGLWGYITLASACEVNVVLYRDLLPDVILLLYRQDELLKTDPSDIIPVLNSVLNKCRKIVDVPNSSSLKMGVLVSIPDTYSMTKMPNKDRINIARLVATWETLGRWSESTGTIVVLSKAFDTPYEKNVQLKTNGWWRLDESLQYGNSTEFKFEAKKDIAKSFDLKENTFHLPNHENSSKLSYGGIIFSLLDNKREKSKFSDVELEPILRGVSRKFSKAMVLLDDDTDLHRVNVLYQLQALSKVKDEFNEVFVTIFPNVDVLRFFSGNVVEISKRAGIAEDLISTYIVSFTGIGNETEEIMDYTRRNAIGNKTMDSYKLGYAFNISICGSFYIMDDEGRDKVNQTFNYDDAQRILFYFEEDAETVKLGARRMFNQRTSIFEQCEKIVAENKNTNGYKLGFVLLHYATDQSFYEDSWALLNFVKYWEMLSQWADTTKTTVIIGNAIDGTRSFKAENRYVRQVGWWRWRDHQSLDSNEWTDKRMDAIRAHEEIQSGLPPSTSGDSTLNATHIVVIAVVPFLLCALVGILAVFCVRRYYKEVLLSKEEIDEFLHGDINCKDGLTLSVENDKNEYENEVAAAVYKLPYDKCKYEIATQHFSVDNDGLLGSGEFGTVCRGKVQYDKQGTPIHVAVKVANPKKFHKTALNGMLSEIKMLAYIGKHENINEMIGANTADLKHGKVFIFLELCQLGCLEKYLRKLRPTMNYDEGEERTVALDDGGRYINMTTRNSQKLDPSLCEDFSRWSKEICSGMAYLATKHVVHADLAARNVLLNLKKEAKLCDFGLSRRMYNYTNYVKQQQEPLPWKWMSPEALRLLQFNEKSDVWAFGVTLWEIYSLGDQPYPGLSWDVNFPTVLEQGLRLGKPKYDDRNM